MLTACNNALLATFAVASLVHYGILSNRVGGRNEVNCGFVGKMSLAVAGVLVLNVDLWVWVPGVWVFLCVLNCVFSFARLTWNLIEKYTLDTLYELFFGCAGLALATAGFLALANWRPVSGLYQVNLGLLAASFVAFMAAVMITPAYARRYTTMSEVYKPIQEAIPEKI